MQMEQTMKTKRMIGFLLMALLTIGPSLLAQEKIATQFDAKKVVSLKVDVVISEYEGTKKVANLPYSFYVNVDDPGRRDTSQIRVGLRVPVNVGGTSGGTGTSSVVTQIQYMDVGTNIDCKAVSSPDGRYRLDFSLDRTYLYSPSQDDQKSTPPPNEGLRVSSGNPIIARFNSSYDLFIKDGQSIEATSTTDPMSGRVLRVSVTANSVK